MSYEKTSEDEIESGAFLDDGMGELDFEEDKESVAEDSTLAEEASPETPDLLAKKAKLQSKNLFSLQARRAIETYEEERRLRKERDYYFDEDFVNSGEENSGKSS